MFPFLRSGNKSKRSDEFHHSTPNRVPQHDLPSVPRIHADVRSTVYCVGVQAGGAREWQFAWARLAGAAPAERELLLAVLGCTRAPYLLYRLVTLVSRL